tara:strand:+ start:11238 stop:11537 length:300 start_codon:yes stop_codon:yes gene_type:complete
MKKGKITKIESACIEGMIANTISADDMALQLDRGVATIEKEIARIKAEAVKQELFINKTASGHAGVSIMTEAASVRGDNNTTNRSSNETQHRNWIHTIN